MTCLSNEASRWASADCTPHGLVPEPARLTKALRCTRYDDTDDSHNIVTIICTYSDDVLSWRLDL